MDFGTQLLKAGVEKAKKENFAKLEAETLFSNKAMIRIAEKVGFKVESLQKMRIMKNGKRENVVLLSMILK
jgi:RimJ/RimL family protein N-acetyltransferase